MSRLAGSLSLALVTMIAGCGGSASSPAPTPTPTSVTVTITGSGASPLSVQIAAGSRVLFINNDSRSHNMTSDPHPEHDACPEINQVGFLSPGQRRETGNIVVAQTCGFHDHDNPDVASLHGQIVIK